MALIPMRVGDANRWRRQYMTWALILVNVVVFIWQSSLPGSLEGQMAFYRGLLAVPANFTNDPLALDNGLDIATDDLCRVACLDSDPVDSIQRFVRRGGAIG